MKTVNSKSERILVISAVVCAVLAVITGIPAFAEAPVVDTALDISGVTISGRTWKNMGYDFLDYDGVRDLPLVAVVMPSLSVSIHDAGPDRSKAPPPFVFGYGAVTALSPVNLSEDIQVSMTAAGLLTFSAGAHIAKSWNYGSYLMMSGTYDKDKKEYEAAGIGDFEYGISGSVTAVIPLGLYSMRLTGGSSYIAFTGADDGQPWKNGINQACVNGWRYTGAATLARRFTGSGKIKSASMTVSASGWYSDSYFDEAYQAYDPTFVTFSVMPMVYTQLTKKQSLIFTAVVSRDRMFEDDDTDNGKMLLQKCTGGVWRLNTVMCVWHIRLN